MISSYVKPSLLYANEWYWCVKDDNGHIIASGWVPDEWLAKAHARVAIKRHQKDRDTP